MSQCAYSLDGSSWTDLPCGPQFDLELNVDEQNTELLTDGGALWIEKLFERNQWELNFKVRTAHVPQFRALHDAIDGQLNKFYFTLDRTADPIIAIYGWKEAGFSLTGTGEPVVPPVFNYRLTISGDTMTTLSVLQSYTLSSLPASPPAGSIVRLSDSPGGIMMFSGLRWVRVQESINVQDAPYNATGDGVTDDSASIQLAINDARATGMSVYFPRAVSGYRCDTELDLTDSDRLTLYGDGFVPPANDLFAVAPTNASTIIGNTGAGKCIASAIGSNGLTIRDLNLSSLGAPTPSTVGLILGTSTRPVAGPGSSAYCMRRVAIYMPESVDSIGVYANNVNSSNFEDVWVVADNPWVYEVANPRGIATPYSAYGPDIDNDGNSMRTCALLSYSGPALWMHHVNDFDAEQVYMNTVRGGPSYSGFAYAVYAANCTDVRFKIEVDYFPSIFLFEEKISNIQADGITFPGTTPIPVDIPIIAIFHGSGSPATPIPVDNVRLNISPIMGATPNSNYHYTSDGDFGLVYRLSNCDFLFDSVASPNVLFANMSTDLAVPIWNVRLNGDTDTITNTFNIDGTPAGTSAYRVFLNGLVQGTA